MNKKDIKRYRLKHIQEGLLMGFTFYEQAIRETHGIGPVLEKRIRETATQIAQRKLYEMR